MLHITSLRQSKSLLLLTLHKRFQTLIIRACKILYANTLSIDLRFYAEMVIIKMSVKQLESGCGNSTQDEIFYLIIHTLIC